MFAFQGGMVELEARGGTSYYGATAQEQAMKIQEVTLRDAACTGSARGLFPGCCCIWMGARIAGSRTATGTI
ncbi:MAG: hypothetical protein ACRD19_05870, partial [Terriglobia bacterium]